MPEFIKAGIFLSDQKSGLPIRNILRKLDSNNELNKIPYVLAERKERNINWFFIRKNDNSSNDFHEIQFIPKKITNTEKTIKRDRDEIYILDLCDEVLGKKGLRQYRFDFLLGDPNTNGIQTRLPVDVYYPELKLVIEYKEFQHSNPVKFFDKENKMTVSGVNRGEQRKIYDKRREEVLPKHGINLICISYTDFNCNNGNRILRNPESDKKIVSNYLKDILIKNS